VPRQLWFGAALLAAEYLLITLSFDARSVGERGGAWSVLGHAGAVGPLAVAVVTGTWLLGTEQLRAHLRELSSALRASPLLRWRPLGAHLLSFSLFVWFTARLFAGEQLGAGAAWWMAGWVTATLASLLFFGFALLPAAAWASLWRPLAPVLGVGAAAGLVTWGLGVSTLQLWQPLGAVTLRLVTFALHGVTDDVVLDPETFVVGTSTFLVRLVPSCSGFEGIGLMLGFLSAFLWKERRSLRFPRALILIPAAVVVVYIGNAFRIAALIMVGSYLSPEVAVGGFHSKAGWVLFCGLALLFAALARTSRFFASRQEPSSPAVRSDTTAYLMPFLAVLATALLTETFSSGGVDLLYGARLVAGAVALWACRDTLRRLAWSPGIGEVGAGLLALGLFILLSPEPADAEVAAWRQEWGTLPLGLQATWLATRLLGFVVLAPIVQELAFRGYLLRRLLAREFEEVSPSAYTALAVLLSSLAYGLMHQAWAAAAATGVVYALAQRRHGRVTDAVAAHAVTNAGAAIYVLAFDCWWMWV
jgi:exosortase E/protease (VPEID-CTERM system)